MVIFCGLAGGLLLRHISPVRAASTITVTSATDDGTGCTLREAIQSSNGDSAVGGCAAGTGPGDTIAFAIAGAGPRTIQPTSGFPALTQSVIIDGYTQPGAAANTASAPEPFDGFLMIQLDGQNAGANPGLYFNGDNITVRGLVINRFVEDAISAGGNNNTIQGNYLGTSVDGLTDLGNSERGVGNGPVSGNGLLIGGLDPEDRNLISGNDGGGSSPNTDHNNWTYQGNYFGVGADGVTTIPNSFVGGPGALSIDNSDGHTVGGTQPGATNVISGNNSYGIFPDNTDNLVIQGNIIGPDWKGDPLVTNPQLGGIGLPPQIGPMDNALIGGTAAGAGNIIAENNGTGIAVLNSVNGVTPLFNSTNVSILGNSIYNNVANPSFPLSTAGLGIDLMTLNVNGFILTNQGVTPNDVGDVDSGPNYFQNYPVITGIETSGDAVTFTYNVDVNTADPGVNGYRVEFFANTGADPSGHGQGEVYLGADTGLTGDTVGRTFTLSNTGLANGSYSFSAVTTATDSSSDGFGSSSEFSANIAAIISPASLGGDGNNGGANTSSGTLADTGLSMYVYIAAAIVLILIGGFTWNRTWVLTHKS